MNPLFKKENKINWKKEQRKGNGEKPNEAKLERGFSPIKKEIAWKILKEPHITEKATELAKENQYVFKVFPKANKIEIKKAVENLFNVDVLSVRKIKIPKKARRIRGIRGWRKGYEKVIVKIKEGQKIEVLPR